MLKNEAGNMKRIENNGNYYREELADASVRWYLDRSACNGRHLGRTQGNADLSRGINKSAEVEMCLVAMVKQQESCDGGWSRVTRR